MKHQRVLLLGETVGTATVGLLYLTSYLRRNHVDAVCQWNDRHHTLNALRGNVTRLMNTVRPTLVGVSIKWFAHMARGLEICRTVKAIAPHVEVVVGGNTASYYWREFIEQPTVDYVIRGDGERPLLGLCRGDRAVPNLVSKNGAAGSAPAFTYIETDRTTDVYLSHLDELFVDDDDPRRCDSLFVYTGKRCNKKCFYCGGCATAMYETYGSAHPFFRPAQVVRRDLAEGRRIARRLLFDFDFEPPEQSQRAYFDEIFVDSWLSAYPAYFYFWRLPHADTIDFLANVFQRVTISIDLASLSERHRLRLQAEPRLGVKPQPTDRDILAIFDQAERHPGLTLDINLISGMPLLDMADMDASLAMVKRLIADYASLGEVQWGRLHAQPGAPILDACQDVGMVTLARTFADFMKFSRVNLGLKEYPDWRHIQYPSILPNDPQMLDAATRHYAEVNELLAGRGRMPQPLSSGSGAGSVS